MNSPLIAVAAGALGRPAGVWMPAIHPKGTVTAST
jgi:hypothetical protein